MSDVNALYDSIVTAGRDLHAMPLATEGNPLSFVVGILITCALVAFGIRKVCLLRQECMEGAECLGIAVALLCFVCSPAPLILGVLDYKPHKGITTAMLRNKEDACSQMLTAISSGQVRWMPQAWEGQVSAVCGIDALVSATNMPGSRYATRT